MSIENLNNIVNEIAKKTSDLLVQMGWTPEEIERVINPTYREETE